MHAENDDTMQEITLGKECNGECLCKAITSRRPNSFPSKTKEK